MNAFLFAVSLILLVLVHYYPPQVDTKAITFFLIFINFVFFVLTIKQAIGV